MQTVQELMELMGSATTEDEARAMQDILFEQNLDPREMTDHDFFALIPLAIKRSLEDA